VCLPGAVTPSEALLHLPIGWKSSVSTVTVHSGTGGDALQGVRLPISAVRMPDFAGTEFALTPERQFVRATNGMTGVP